MALKDQSTIPKATFIEIGVLQSRSEHAICMPTSAERSWYYKGFLKMKGGLE